MTKRLFFNAILKFLSGVAATALLLFLPAGTVNYPGAWLLMAVLFIPMLFAGIFLMIKSPLLLEKRLGSREKQPEQKRLIALCALMFVCGFITAGLNFRFRIFVMPFPLCLIFAALAFAAYLLYAEVLRENRYLSRTVEVSRGQQVISTGLYGIIRHPMYLSTVVLFLSVPFVLGSPLSAIVFLFYPLLITKRIKHEETLLKKELEGYAAYTEKVKYKLLPFIW